MHPTKHQIALLYAHNFKLWDGSHQWHIESLHNGKVSIVLNEGDTLINLITFEDIGRGFKVIRRPLSDLTVAEEGNHSAVEILADKYYTYPIEKIFKRILEDNEDWVFSIEAFLYDELMLMGFFPSLADDCCVDVNVVK